MQIKISSDDRNRLVLSNSKGKEISFKLSDKFMHDAICAYLKLMSGYRNLDVKTVMFGNNSKFLQFDTGYMIKLTDAAHFEISNRLILLNEQLTCVQPNDVPRLEDEEELMEQAKP